MNFVDLIKDSVLKEFSGSISVGNILLSLLTSCDINLYNIYL